MKRKCGAYKETMCIHAAFHTNAPRWFFIPTCSHAGKLASRLDGTAEREAKHTPQKRQLFLLWIVRNLVQPHKADKNHSYFTGVEQGRTADALLCLGARSNLPSGYIESTVCARSRRTCLQGICHLRAVFGAGGVFGESVFARHLRAGIRLRSRGRLRGIRLR